MMQKHKVTTIIHFLLIALSNAVSAEEATVNLTPNRLLPHRTKDSPTIAGITNEESSESHNRIVGGTWVKRGAHPYQVAIMIRNIGFHCGGTLIETSHILTAAHCLDVPDIAAEKIKIYLLTTVLDPLDDNHIERGVTKYVTHEHFTNFNWTNDVAILTLDRPVLNVRPVRLEEANSHKDSYVDEIALVIGWGRVHQVLYPEYFSPGPYSNNLRETEVTVIGTQDCNILFDNRCNFDDGERICVASLHGKGTCQGDSGGPLLMNGVQIGITSSSAGCADPRLPTIFARISAHRDWITKNTM